ncbi:MAG: hypothetical protein QNJ16_09505 [Rhodobacter sp.]|nr:hypothetical protein [Rhodobacter sp.]
MRGPFDFGVFAVSLGALALSWARMWVFVPEILRNEQHETAQWDRYDKNDWALLGVLSEFSGREIDAFRDDIEHARNDAVRATLEKKAPDWTDEDRRRFLAYFVEDLSDLGAVYIDEDGKIEAFD